jgi:WD40 repeat protein
VHYVHYYSEKKMLISAWSNGLIIFWNATDGEIIGANIGHQSGVSRSLFFEENEILITGSLSGELKIWKLGQVPDEIISELKSLTPPQ